MFCEELAENCKKKCSNLRVEKNDQKSLTGMPQKGLRGVNWTLGVVSF
tara:strand:+ start:1114 stop:1257 length:144 start_codon:yes stop_codon:yes gene_type:complete